MALLATRRDERQNTCGRAFGEKRARCGCRRCDDKFGGKKSPGFLTAAVAALRLVCQDDGRSRRIACETRVLTPLLPSALVEWRQRGRRRLAVGRYAPCCSLFSRAPLRQRAFEAAARRHAFSFRSAIVRRSPPTQLAVVCCVVAAALAAAAAAVVAAVVVAAAIVVAAAAACCGHKPRARVSYQRASARVSIELQFSCCARAFNSPPRLLVHSARVGSLHIAAAAVVAAAESCNRRH